MLFESAADIFQSQLIGIVLSGMGQDGAEGLLEINQTGGLCAIQKPKSTRYSSMPEAALRKVPTAQRISPESFALWLNHVLST